VTPRAGVTCATLIAAVACVLPACTASVLPAAGPLVQASPQQFMPALSVTVSHGSIVGLEPSGTVSVWWLNEAKSTITAYNNSHSTARLSVTAIVAAPRCASDVTVGFKPVKGTPVTLTAGQSGANVVLSLVVAAASSQQITVSTVTSGCRLPGDARTFYAGLLNLRVQQG
jgi:hypothetical protein